MSSFQFAGSVSSATMRPQDLVPRFRDVLRELNQARYNEIFKEDDPVIPFNALHNDDHRFWDSEDCQWLVNDLFDALDDSAPDGYFFGSHEGDGADYGFWQYDPEVLHADRVF